MIQQTRVSKCHICGSDAAKGYTVRDGDAIIWLCPKCYEKYVSSLPTGGLLDYGVELLYPELNARHSPLSTMIMRSVSFREAMLPLGITIKRKESEKAEAEKVEEGAPVRKEEIGWDILVGAEPIDELKAKGIAHVLAAKFAEDNGVVTSKDLARFLADMAQNPELEPYLERFKTINEDAAREILNDLADMGIVKKEFRKGAKGANIYDYLSAERSWRKDVI